MKSQLPQNMWEGLGKRKNYRDVPIYEVSDSLCPKNVLLIFHAWSHLGSKLTQVFIHLITNPSMLLIDSHSMRMIESITIIQYDPICTATGINEASRIMFTQKLKLHEPIPPTKHALFQHAKRAVITANYYWSQSLHKESLMLSPAGYGLLRNERFKSWSNLPEVSKACSLLVSCHKGCKHGKCGCARNFMKGTSIWALVRYMRWPLS